MSATTTESARFGSTVAPVERVEDAQRDRFESMVRDLSEPLVRYFARRVSPADDSYDCLSETLIVLWKHRGNIPTPSEERRAWAFGVARNVLANYKRQQRRRERLLEKSRVAADTGSSESPGDSWDLGDLLASLSQRDAELVRLVVWDGLGVAEAGTVLGLKAAAARARYSRARAKLRSRLSAISSERQDS